MTDDTSAKAAALADIHAAKTAKTISDRIILGVESSLHRATTKARDAGLSWDEIATALGSTNGHGARMNDKRRARRLGKGD